MSRSCLVLAIITGCCFQDVLFRAALACENEYPRGSQPQAPYDSVWEFAGSAYVKKLRDRHEGEAFSPEEKLKLFQESGDFRDEANYAVALMRTGEAAKAREILEHLVKEHAEEYVLAANLGTAYELTGDNEQALAWIRKGIALNPNAHNGTERLHVKILQAKIAAEKDPEWFAKNSVLKLNFGSDPIPVTPGELERDDDGRPLTLEAIRKGLEYQLHERLFYVKPQDHAVASLLLTLANILYLDGAREESFHVLQLAGEYHPEGVQPLAAKLTAINPYNRGFNVTPPGAPIDAPDPLNKMFRRAFISALGALAIVVVSGVFGWKRRRQ